MVLSADVATPSQFLSEMAVSLYAPSNTPKFRLEVLILLIVVSPGPV